MNNRREFLQVTGFALAAAGLEAQENKAEWYGRPMRWMQLAFVEDDPGKYDPDFWLDYFRRVHADAACLSAGGCVAFYPTKVPLPLSQQVSGGSRPFGEMVKGCREHGHERDCPHRSARAHQDVYDAHPEWIAVEAEGSKRRHWADPTLWVTCALGGYNFDFMTDVTIEIVRDYKVDGIFSNRWSGSGMCYCKSCRTLFHDYSGHDLPRTNESAGSGAQAVYPVARQRLFDLWRLWDTEIKKINPNAAFWRTRAAVR